MPKNSNQPSSPEQGTLSRRAPLIAGMIVEGSRGIYRVQTADGNLRCTLRGRLRKQLEYGESTSGRKGVRQVKVMEKDPIAPGDRVRLLPTENHSGIIEEILPRESGDFSRRDPGKGQANLTTVAGLDQIVTVFAVQQPEPHLRQLDRFLVLAEAQEMDALICFNKLDLGVEPWLSRRLEVYRSLDYPVLLTSAGSGAGIAELRERLAGKTSAFLGSSGVGKTSLLNAVQNGLGERTSAISDTTHKGRHTTTGTRLFPLTGPDGGFLADTAGIRAFAFNGSLPRRLDQCFREFRPYLGACVLSDCNHRGEPKCAVRAAAQGGTVDPERYDSYCRLVEAGVDLGESE
ncbi:MAG: ribosome small subunit-dependent GTPase A [Dehalococcoidia bacterium]